MRRAVVFGAGSIGRGFVGASLSLSGWRVTFVDVVPALVDRLKHDGHYRQLIAETDGERINLCQGIDAVLFDDHPAVNEALLRADLAVTAVGAENLPRVAEAVMRALPQRLGAGRESLDLFLCENLHDVADVMRSHMQALGDSTPVGLAATSVGRIVPLPTPDPLYPTQVKVEAYDLLPYDATALRGGQPEVAGFVPVWDDFSIYADRKLYVFNMGHCMTAYLGDLWGHSFIWEAIGDISVRYLVRGAMLEAAAGLSAAYGTPFSTMLLHVDDLLARFGNRALADTCARVGRDPWRKMQPADRILGGYRVCLNGGIKPLYMSLAVALGAWRLAQEDGWTRDRVEEHLRTAVFAGDEDAASLVSGLWSLLDAGASPARIVARLDEHMSSVPVA